jgi:hypothetical protein
VGRGLSVTTLLSVWSLRLVGLGIRRDEDPEGLPVDPELDRRVEPRRLAVDRRPERAVRGQSSKL